MLSSFFEWHLFHQVNLHKYINLFLEMHSGFKIENHRFLAFRLRSSVKMKTKDFHLQYFNRQPHTAL